MDEMNPGRVAPPVKKPPNLFVRFLAFLVTLALMVGAVALVVNYDKLNFDSLKRWFTYRNLERSESGQSESFVFEGGESSQFAVLDHELLVCSGKDVRLYSGSEQVSLDQAISIQNPVVDTVGNAWSTTLEVSPCSYTGTGRRSFPCLWKMGSSCWQPP